MQEATSSEASFHLRAAARRLNRLRWNAKAKNVRRYGADGASFGARARYVLWDPEVRDFSFDLADLDAAAAFLSNGFQAPAERVRELLEEPAAAE